MCPAVPCQGPFLHWVSIGFQTFTVRLIIDKSGFTQKKTLNGFPMSTPCNVGSRSDVGLFLFWDFPCKPFYMKTKKTPHGALSFYLRHSVSPPLSRLLCHLQGRWVPCLPELPHVTWELGGRQPSLCPASWTLLSEMTCLDSFLHLCWPSALDIVFGLLQSFIPRAGQVPPSLWWSLSTLSMLTGIGEAWGNSILSSLGS